MSSSSRASRSRVSSPFTKNNPTESANKSADGSAKPKTFMDRWVEPERPAPRPSFAEAGLERHNVVLNMAPLGTLPTAKQRKPLQSQGAEGTGRLGSARKSATSSASTPGESIMTPEPTTTNSERRQSVSTNKTEEERIEESVTTPVPETPKKVSSPDKRTVSHMSNPPPPPPSQLSGQGVFALRRASPVPMVTPAARSSLPASSRITTPGAHHNGPRPVDFELCDKVVAHAVEEALERYRYPTAYALRTLYDDHRANIRIVRLIESIYTESATDEQKTEFNSIMKHKKREGKKNRTGEYYFLGDGSDPPQHRPIFQAISALNPPPREPYRTPYTPLPRTNSVGASEPHVSASSFKHQSPFSATASVHTESDHAHVNKKQKPNDFQPDNRELTEEINGVEETSASNTNVDADVDVEMNMGNNVQNSDSDAVEKDNDTEIMDDDSHVNLDGDADDTPVVDSTADNVDAAAVINTQQPSPTPSPRKAANEENASSQSSPENDADHVDPTTKNKPTEKLASNSDSSPEKAADETSPLPPKDTITENIARPASPEKDAGPEQRARSRSRSGSASSTSSLSSIDEGAISGAFASAKNSPAVKSSSRPFSVLSYASEIPVLGSGHGFEFGGPVAQPRFVSPYTNAKAFKKAAAETLAQRNQQPPITKPGPRFHTFAVTPSSSSAAATPSSSNNTPTNPSNQTSSMAPAVLPPSTTSVKNLPGGKYPPTFRVKIGKKLHGFQPLDENDESSRLKRKARETAAANYNPKESYDRHQVAISSPQAPQDIDSQSDGPDSISVAPSKPPKKKQRSKITLNVKTRETRHSSSRPNNYDSEENNLSSPTTLGFQPHLAPGSTPSSRAATPSVSSRQPTRKAKTGKGLRVKSSPIKNNKKGTSAGMPRSGERGVSPMNGVSSANQDVVENDDFCSACGGNGDLVCCDGKQCRRSFHFVCVDPPLVGDLPDEWFCNECKPPERPVEDYPTIFQQLLYNLDTRCARAFSLPEAIRDYFEDVKTGNEGEYEEVQAPKPKSKGWEEPPDYFRLRDGKGNPIFCYECQGQAEAPSRSIIPCTFCGLYWHMDCLPVPLAREPGPGRPWRCPAHVDDLLSKLPELLGPAHRFRKIKGASVIRPVFSRGMRNNGYIEIENEHSDNEDEQSFFEQKEYGHVYKLPEKGIKLDFISKVKEMGGGFRRDLPTTRPHFPPAVDVWNSRTIEEQQAALNLASMIPQASIPQSTSRLISTLLAEAPPTVLALIAQGSSDTIAQKKKMTKSDRQSVIAAIEALKAKLAADGSEDSDDEKSTLPHPAEGKASTSTTEKSGEVNGDAEMQFEP